MQIADELGVSPQRAHIIVSDALEKIRTETAEEAEALRTLELERLDRLWLQCYQSAQQGDLPAVDRCLRIMERRSKLLGLDAPTKVSQTDSTGQDVPVIQEITLIKALVLQAIPDIDSRARLASELLALEEKINPVIIGATHP